MKQRFSLTAALVTSCVATLVGCNAFDSDDDKHVAVTDSSMYMGVPSNAVRSTNGYGTIRYRATSNSRVIIGDDVRRVVLTETTLQSGEEVVVNPEGDSVTVNGRVVYNQNLLKSNQHSIFVVPQ